ncbi:hypothetical protein [Mesobacillus jeotgali]|uniref:hypothetical protein n=1 Tax=Mesobacillus jeotgali TaxID=129985 RepID=UPI0009A5E8D8|nr:hypothetical protein [Mesobacillus jeotgali]
MMRLGNGLPIDLEASFYIIMEDISEGKHVSYYHIVKDQEAYDGYMASLTADRKMEINSMEPFESYTTVEISEDGNVSISI